MKNCEKCSAECLPDGMAVNNDTNTPEKNLNFVESASKLHEQDEQIRRLELELAQTKLALVESQCRNQDLTHQLASNLQETKNTWFKKTITTIKEATRNPNSNTNSTSSSNSMLKRETSRDSATGSS